MPYGYTGRILHVDLAAEETWIETPPESFYRHYVGGSAMGMYYILKEMRPGVNPLDPENILTLMLSVFTGVPISGQSRMSANAKSPLVDGIGDSEGGGFFPAEMKFAGFDGVVVRGQAGRPVYLWLHDGQAEIRDATHLWGRTTSEVDEILKQELEDDKIEIAQCGPAGEKLVRLAAIINMANRANGRTGMGAVMGSKKLKAVVVRGKSRHLPTADPKSINELAKWGAANVEANPSMRGLKLYGTAGVTAFQHATGTLPTRNYNEGQFEAFEAITGETMAETILKRRETCYACAVRCKRAVETEWRNQPVAAKHGGPEFETIATFGSYCGVGDLNAIAYAHKLCSEYGLDTIGTGATIAWAMECYENGLLSETQIGFALRFGDSEAMIRLVRMIAQCEGFGDVLAEGSRKAADKLGVGHEYLITVKGSEAPGHMPQAKRSLGLIYAVNPFGADHKSSEQDPRIEEGLASELQLDRLKMLGCNGPLTPRSLDEDKVRFALRTQYFYSFMESANLCVFVWSPAWTLYGPQETVDMVRAVTGWQDFDLDELMQIGARRLNMLRAFNAREGLDRKHDRLPRKFFKPLRGTGPTAGTVLTETEIERAKDMYYEMAGWDIETGTPTEARLRELELDWVAELLSK